ncbi:LexA-binding, inner membrane-associated putative hydrolase [Natronoarchaeum philippinense]|uniref:LexA-binding, inner membrane-associated putative hydrolase n=1 Tax=Natronoarchaeum philippinense TaxID=558529 RepID=A0A285N9Q8_NATPI|nr:metal-dependent hydrolase [Natronoarchaeum philippinense]SNZ06028.1 LexA-binding, inner membrane-associated putative hydrolase [Natronoarchaeum philippinense]
MFLGHALLAFALATLVADWRGWSARRALTLGVVTGAFAAIPDVDVAYAAFALDFGGLTPGAMAQPSTFWDATRDVHRTMTHSLVISILAGPAFGLWAVTETGSRNSRIAGRGVAVVVLAGLIGVAYLTSGPLGGVVMSMFAVAGVGVAALCRLATDLPARTVGLAATAGLLSHPWGDLVTGAPPRLFYPFDARVLDARVLLHGDPTVHLLGAFALELATIWLAALAIAHVADRSWPSLVDRRAGIGVAYGVAAVAMAPPTLDVSYHFVFSILSVGLLCGGVSARSAAVSIPRRLRRQFDFRPLSSATPASRTAVGVRDHALGVAVTSLAGITAALASYVLVYAALAASIA